MQLNKYQTIFAYMKSIHERTWGFQFSEREKKFLLEMAKTGDIVESARKADYDESVVQWQGERILSKIEAKIELKTIRDEIGVDMADMSKEELVEELKIIATASITDYYDEFGYVKDIDEIDPIKAKAIKEVKRTVHPKTGAVTVTLTMHDKISALQNLGRIGGHFAADNGQQQGDINIQVVVPGGMANL